MPLCIFEALKVYRGYIKLWRKIQDNSLWKEPRVFSRAEAWIDMLMLANHEKGHIRKRGILIEVGRGEIGWSEVELAKRWKWSRGKVRRFFSELSSKTVQQIEQKIEHQNKYVTSRYLILNYEFYHGDSTAKDTAKETEGGQQTDSKRYRNKNDKNEKNIKEKYIWLDLELWKDFRKHRMNLKAPMTPRAEKIILDKLDNLNNGEDRNSFILKSIECGWKGIFPPEKEKESKYGF